jgi:hypothetical protein
MGKRPSLRPMRLAPHPRGMAFCSYQLEMSAEEIGERMAADLCFDGELQVPYSAITDWAVNREQARWPLLALPIASTIYR